MPNADDSVDELLRAVAAAPPLPISRTIGDRFVLSRRLGEGTFGVVYQAEDKRDGKRVALKMLRYPSADWIHRFKREFRALRDLRHNNLVALEELFCVDERWFFTMELLEGVNIIDYVRCDGGSDGPRGFHEGKLRSAFGQLMEGLGAFHATGRVHRDLKPSNVLVTRDDRVVLLDFGLATEASTVDEAVSAIVGTPAYMAPEQAAGRAVDAAADLYAAGVLLYEMLTGHRPARDHRGERSTVDPQAPSAGSPSPRMLDPRTDRGRQGIAPSMFPADCPADLVTCCLALTDRAPAQRPTADAVAARVSVGPVRRTRPSRPSVPQQLLVGRDGEIAVLRTALADVERGELTSVVIHGESGIGKTSLTRRFLEPFRSSEQHLVLTGRCYERESVPFKAFDEIVDSLSEYLLRQSRLEIASLLPRNAGYLCLLFPVIGRVDGFDRLPHLRKDTSDPNELRHRAFLALRDLFGGLAESRTVIVHIDDLQWADQDSVVLLSKLLATPDPPRMLLLATSRELIDLAALGIGGAVRQVELGPLDREHAVLLARQLLPAPAGGDASAIESLLEDAHGHPYFILELVRHISRAAGRPGSRLNLDEAIWFRALGESVEALRVLKYVCVSGVPIDAEALGASVQMPLQDLLVHCTALTREHLIRTIPGAIVPYHDRVRETVIGRLAADELSELHARLAVVFGERGDLALEVRHLEASGQHAEAARASIAAARKARQGLGFEQAAAFYRYALRLGSSSDAVRGDLLIELGSTLVAMGKGFEASEVYAEATQVVDADKRLACNIEVAHQLLTSGYLDQGILKLRELFAEQGMSYPSTPTSVLLQVVWQRITGALRDPRRLPAPRRDPTASERARIALYRAAIQGLVLVDPLRAALCVERALRLTRKIGDQQEYYYFLLLAGDLRWSESSRERTSASVVVAFDQLLERDPGVLSPTIVTVHKSARTYMNMRGGDSEALDALINADEQLARTRIAPWELVGGRTFLLILLRRLGRYRELKQRFQSYLLDARRRNDVYSQATMRGFCNLLYLVDDDAASARDELASTIWISLQHGFHVQHWYDFNALMELHLYQRQPPSLAYLDQQLTEFSTSRLSILAVFAVETEWLIGRLSLAFPELPRHGRPRIRAAIRRLERTSAAYPRLLAAQLRAGLACSGGDTPEAIAQLRSALSLGKSMDMRVQPAIVSHHLGALLGGNEGDALRERATATLAAEGVRDIARFADLMIPGFTRQ